MSLSWRFEAKESDDGPGWNASIVTTFTRNRLKSLACEVLQNSSDNQSEDTDEPVRVIFSEVTVDREQIPGVVELTSRLEAVLESALGNESEDHIEEIKQALDVVRAPRVACLKITDQNTTGMKGPDTRGNKFHTYLRTEGSSGGSGDRGGSHGHGKGAVLTLSDLRTIFVSTNWKDESGNIQSLFQGRATFMVHAVGGAHYGHIGYFGKEQKRASQTVPSEFDWLKQESGVSGSTITIVGWQKPKKWEKRLLAYAISHYFPAFIRGKLEVNIGGQTVTKDNISEWLFNVDFLNELKNYDNVALESVQNAKNYCRCLLENGDHIKVTTKQLTPKPGKSEFRLIVEDGLPRNIGIIRNNMFICEARSLDDYWTRIPGDLKDFVGLYQCTNNTGQRLLRGMEPPEHNALHSDNLPSSKREDGEKALRRIGNALKDFARENARFEIGSGSAVEWMREFFADDAGDGGEVDPSEDINPEGRFIVTPRPRSIPAVTPIVIEPPAPPVPPPPPVPPVPPGPPPSETTASQGLSHVRLIRLTDLKYKVVLRSEERRTLKIGFFEVGADFHDSLNAVSSSIGLLSEGKIILEIERGKVIFTVEFERALLGGLRLVAQKEGGHEI